MLTIVEMPINHLSDHELQVREWEAVMSSGYGSIEHNQLKNELQRRSSSPIFSRPEVMH